MRASAVLAGGFLIYTAFWSYVSLAKLYSLKATVFDLGVNMQYAWVSVHSSQTVLHTIATRAIVYAVAPVFLLGGYPAVLVFQSAFIGAGVFPLYFVARREIGSRGALPLSLSYLAYFPLAGINWFDFHYQALFPTLFLFGWYFWRVKRRVLPAFAMFALASLTHYPYSVFAGLLGLMLLTEWRRKVRGALTLSLLLIGFSLFTFVLAAYELGFSGATAQATGVVTPSGVRGGPLQEVVTVVLILSPLLFLPLISRWSAFLLPYLTLLVFSGNPVFTYPLVFELQYTSLFVCFVFLGAAEGIARMGSTEKRRLVLSLLVLVGVGVSSAFLAPYGPLNHSPTYTMAGLSINPSPSYRALEAELSLVKPGSVLLVENNMPEAFPGRDGTTPVDTLYLTDNFLDKTQPDYVVADLNSSWYTSPGVDNVTMEEMFNQLWESGNYSLIAESAGIIMLKKGSSSLKYYSPENAYFPASSFKTPQGGGMGLINVTQPAVTPSIVWYGPYTYLEPGLFNVSFEIDSQASRGLLLLEVTADYGHTTIAEYPLNLSTLHRGWRNVSFEFYVDSAYIAVEFRALASQMNGRVLFRGVRLTQVMAGLPVYPDAVYNGFSLMHSSDVSVTKNGWLNLTGSQGIVWYGPYVELEQGNYTLKFDFALASLTASESITLQVTADSGEVTLANLTLNTAQLREESNVSLSFSLGRSYANVEFRGLAPQQLGKLYLAGITLLRNNDPSPKRLVGGSAIHTSSSKELMCTAEIQKLFMSGHPEGLIAVLRWVSLDTPITQRGRMPYALRT